MGRYIKKVIARFNNIVLFLACMLGDSQGFDLEIALDSLPKPLTNFQVLVMRQLIRIPRGSVTSYGRIAKALKIPSAQAVGQAVSRNPFVPDVPCHRVVNADGSIGGYCGSLSVENIQKKIKLLTDEGVKFDRKGKVVKSCFYD